MNVISLTLMQTIHLLSICRFFYKKGHKTALTFSSKTTSFFITRGFRPQNVGKKICLNFSNLNVDFNVRIRFPYYHPILCIISHRNNFSSIIQIIFKKNYIFLFYLIFILFSVPDREYDTPVVSHRMPYPQS